MDDAYIDAIKNNELVVGYALGYQQTYDVRYLHGIHTLLEATSKQIIFSVLGKAGLSYDLADDMLQDAYIRLRDAVICYQWDKCPVFVTYWRTTLRNHLITNYSNQWRCRLFSECKEDKGDETELEFLENSHTPNHIASLALKELEEKITVRINSWEDEKYKALSLAILKERILQPEENRTLQKELATRFGIQPALVSHWESWLRDTITSEYLSIWI